MPRFSIIIPVYNAETYLSRCINSIIAQTYQDWELILIDDGSTDSSRSICDKYVHLDNRISVNYQKNAGPGSARNHGLNLANGEYIFFIDADDWLEKEHVNAFNNAIGIYEPDIVFQGFTQETSNAHKQSFAFNSSTNNESLQEIICKLYKGRNFGWVWNKVFKLAIIKDNDIRFNRDIRLWEDELFTIHFLKHVKTAVSLNTHTYHYNFHNGSLMHNPPSPLVKLETKELIYHELRPLCNDDLFKHITITYLNNFKFCMLMVLTQKTGYECSDQYREQMISKYFTLEREYPEIKHLNIYSNKIKYWIIESILKTHEPVLISRILSLL